MTLPLSWNEIEHRAAAFAAEWVGTHSEDADAKPFWDAFFEVFGVSRRKVASFERRVNKLGTAQGKIDLLWKGTLLIEHKSLGRDLGKALTQAFDYFPGLKPEELPRYVLVCDFNQFELHDLEAADGAAGVHRFTLSELPANIHLFSFIAGYTVRPIRENDPVNQQAVIAIGELHDALKQGNYTGEPLEVFLVRLLFCLFADDTGIFQPKDSFHDLIEFHTRDDGSDVGQTLETLFATLNTKPEARQTRLAEHFALLPYVNGKLFEAHYPAPTFDSELRKQLLALCSLNWGAISPAIFGAMFQTVIELDATNRRRQLGAHYTSEANILKLLRPLCMDELRAEFLAVKNSQNKLFEFLKRLSALTFLDPACGCGNFLVIAYRELRELELDVLRAARQLGAPIDNVFGALKVNVDQFYGIEIEEFPAQIAQVAMWLTDHQMNVQAGAEFGRHYDRIPLLVSAHIRHADALDVDWTEFVPPQRLNFILGNPPFIGKHYQSKAQKDALVAVTVGMKNAGLLDFVAGWYIKAAQYLCASPDNFNGIALKANVWRKRYTDVRFGPAEATPSLFISDEKYEVARRRQVRCAFVSTNSITQGEQVGVLWSELHSQGIHIQFAHRTFQWTNDAPGKAAVHCVIIGFGMDKPKAPVIYDYPDIKKDPIPIKVAEINPYLMDTSTVFLGRRSMPICAVPGMGNGGKPTDGGHLLLSDEERTELLRLEPGAKKWIRPFVMGDEFINNITRWCLWLEGMSSSDLNNYPHIKARVDQVRQMRLSSAKAATRQLAGAPMAFGEIRQPKSNYYLAIPKVSSEKRPFIPMGFLDSKTICGDKIFFIEDASLFHFGILTSSMHMAWMRRTCGRLKSDYSYSNSIVYNNYPWPISGHAQCKEQAPDTYARIEAAAQAVLDERAKESKASLAILYDDLLMPWGLRKAHKTLDYEVDRAYMACGGKRRYEGDTDRVAFLFGLYARYTSLVG